MSTLPQNVQDAASGIALMYMTPDRMAGDELTTRLMVAMETDNLGEVEHVTALMVGSLAGRGDMDGMRFCAEQWSATFHPTPSESSTPEGGEG